MSRTEERADGSPGKGPRPRGVLVFLLVLDVVVVGGLWSLSSASGGRDLAVARRFVDALAVGAAEMPGAEGAAGYDVAYGLLAESLRSALSFDDFVSGFEERVERQGFLEAGNLLSEGGAFGRRELAYELVYTGREGRPVRERLDLVLAPSAEDYVVVAWTAAGD